MNRPLIAMWNIYFEPSRHNVELETVYASQLVVFLDSANVGDTLTLIPRHAENPEPTYCIIGRVYGRDGFDDGEGIATSDIYGFERVADDAFGATFIAHTKNTDYYIHAVEARELLRVKASK